MKCKRHPCEQGVGVCAPCLRDRLLIVLAEQQTHPSPEIPHRRQNILLPIPTEDSRSNGRILHGCNAFSFFPSLSALIHRHSNRNEKKKKKARYRPSDRGMSPAIDDQESDSNASASGYTTDSSAGIRRHTTPARPVAGGGFAGFSMCLSPMVRPGHAGRRQRRQQESTSAGFSGEIGRNGNPVRFGPNRSRKLADRGRSWR